MSEVLARLVGLGLLAESHLVQFRALAPVVGTVDVLSSGFAHGSLSSLAPVKNACSSDDLFLGGLYTPGS